jgi:hypothetical protein
MPYLNCPSCRLSLSVDESAPTHPHCPRCLRRDDDRIPMSMSDEPRRMFPGGLHELADAVVQTKRTRERLS